MTNSKKNSNKYDYCPGCREEIPKDDRFNYYYTADTQYSFTVNRPQSCKESACMCLCRSGLKIDPDSGVVGCGELICHNLGKNTDFADTYTPSFKSERDISNDQFNGGFFMMRGAGPSFLYLAATGTNTPELIANENQESRRRAFYLEKENGQVKVYEKSPLS